MESICFSDCCLKVDTKTKRLAGFSAKEVSLLAAPSELFTFSLMDEAGRSVEILSSSCRDFSVEKTASSLVIRCVGFSECPVLQAVLCLDEKEGALECRVSFSAPDPGKLIEWVRLLPLRLPALKGDGGELGGEILMCYNEGLVMDTLSLRSKHRSDFGKAPSYPSDGYFSVFPNMVQAQLIAYRFGHDGGFASLYLGAHDPSRAPKEINVVSCEGGVGLVMRYFCGVGFGEPFSADFPLVLKIVGGDWQDAAEVYRGWFASALPSGLKKIAGNPDLPQWYTESPLVVTYPVRGVHDKDIMEPNALYPYTNALPLVDEISRRTGARILVLLMHWEGTAPWCPPYVLPPYGDRENFRKFLDSLHERGQLMGVYCSGFGYTLRSNLVDYDNLEEFEKEKLIDAMCAGPDGKVLLSPICTGQRSGYDSCPASPKARGVLEKAYRPLLESDLDYVQILDQNHGGGQYLCYSRAHSHPPAPGGWMTEKMSDLLCEWRRTADKTLLGCESAAAEPFIPFLSFSDDRFELNFKYGRPVPLYSYIYHEYVRNFMGNQCGCVLPVCTDSLNYRLAYSFAAGDSMTLALYPDGRLLSHWSLKDFSVFPDRDVVFTFISRLVAFYKKIAGEFLSCGKMIKGPPLVCGDAPFGNSLPALLASAWETGSKRVQIVVNPFERPILCTLGGTPLTVPALSPILIDLP